MPKIGQYGNKWKEYKIIHLGGFWAVVVGIIEDIRTGDTKIRIAKGKIKGKTKRSGDTFVVSLDDKDDPITQVSRLNIKKMDEWENIKKAVDHYSSTLEPSTKNVIIK